MKLFFNAVIGLMLIIVYILAISVVTPIQLLLYSTNPSLYGRLMNESRQFLLAMIVSWFKTIILEEK